jgi:integrase
MPAPRYSVDVYERAGSPFWYARCYIEGQGGADKRWSTGVPVGTRKKESKRAARRVAEERAAALAAEAHGLAAASTSLSFDAVAERMLAHKGAEGKRPRTMEALAQLIDKHSTPFFGANRDVRTIRRADLESFKSQMHAEGLAPVTINNNLTAVRQILKHAWRIEGLLEAVPDVPNVRVSQESKGRALTPEEFGALFASIDPRAREAQEWLLFLVNTGLRKSEALAIRWDWIDWDKRELRVPAEHRKGAARQPVPLPLNDVALALLRARQERPKQPSKGRVWMQQKHDSARNSAAEKAGLGRVRNHDLRHTFGSLAHASGASLPEVRDLLGHTTLAMVSRYAHTYSGRLHDTAARVQIAVPGGVSGERSKSAGKARKRSGGVR